MNETMVAPLEPAASLVLDVLRDVLGDDYVVIDGETVTMNIVDALVKTGLATSKTAARRLLKSYGAVKVNQRPADATTTLSLWPGHKVSSYLLARGRERRVLAWVVE